MRAAEPQSQTSTVGRGNPLVAGPHPCGLRSLSRTPRPSAGEPLVAGVDERLDVLEVSDDVQFAVDLVVERSVVRARRTAAGTVGCWCRRAMASRKSSSTSSCRMSSSGMIRTLLSSEMTAKIQPEVRPWSPKRYSITAVARRRTRSGLPYPKTRSRRASVQWRSDSSTE